MKHTLAMLGTFLDGHPNLSEVASPAGAEGSESKSNPDYSIIQVYLLPQFKWILRINKQLVNVLCNV